MNRIERTDIIKATARELGFDLVGIASADQLIEEGGNLRRWLGAGYHAEMNYMARAPERRIDPRALLPDARSVICVAMNYFVQDESPPVAHDAKISRYARGDDYHDVLESRLERLVDFLRSLSPDATATVCVDRRATMDKAWAVRSGIGWLGKHSNVINREIGSWFFLGEVITSLDLVADAPIEEFCGTCTACIDACPTDAIVQDYVVDSARCISFHTIESKQEEIPHVLGARFENWIFGCDICQDVCPWNSFARTTTEARFFPRDEIVATAPQQFLAMNPSEFELRFAGNSIMRARLSGMQRNARNLLRRAASNE